MNGERAHPTTTAPSANIALYTATTQTTPQQLMPAQSTLDKPKPVGRQLMEITAISGEYPAGNIPRLIPAQSYAKKVLSSLIADKLIKQVSDGGLKGYRLTPKGKRSLVSDNPARFAGLFEGASETNKMRSGYERRLRLHSLAEVCTLMIGAGVGIFADVKPKVYILNEPTIPSQPSIGSLEGEKSPRVNSPTIRGSPNQHAPIVITGPCFYTSREQKGQHDNAIRGSRAAGILLTPAHVYAIYNTSNVESRWSEKIEQRYKAEVQDYICRKLLFHQYQGVAVGGIMVGYDMETLEKYLVAKGKQQTTYHFLTKVYTSFYYITNDTYGEAQLKLLCNAEKMTALKNILIKGLHQPDAKHPIEHDALTEDGSPVLFCCLLDIPRLIRFRNGVALHGKIGRVIAFDFQVDMLCRYMGDMAEFVGISFDKFSKMFFRK